MTEETRGIQLNSHFTNELKVGEVAWFIKDDNPSTGYSWRFRPDNSGVYAENRHILLEAHTKAVGVPGSAIWKFKAVRPGHGEMLFELYPPASKDPSEWVTVNVNVK